MIAARAEGGAALARSRVGRVFGMGGRIGGTILGWVVLVDVRVGGETPFVDGRWGEGVVAVVGALKFGGRGGRIGPIDAWEVVGGGGGGVACCDCTGACLTGTNSLTSFWASSQPSMTYLMHSVALSFKYSLLPS